MQKGHKLTPFYFICLLLALSCSADEQTEPFCQISIPLYSDSIFQTALIPIVLMAFDENPIDIKIELSINGILMEKNINSPYVYYWKTDENAVGEHTIEASFQASNEKKISDKYILNIKAVSRQCPSSVIDIDGNIYSVIRIGNQCWTSENLRTTHYADGTPLLNGIDSAVGALPNDLPGWYFAYDGNESSVDTFGYLYTWTSAMKGNQAFTSTSGPIQGICPDGWHVPSLEEWYKLVDHLGGSDLAGFHLRDTSLNLWPPDFTNSDEESLFRALPGGCRISFGPYIEKGMSAYIWSSTETIVNHAYHLYLNDIDNSAYLLGHQDSERFAYSIRCVKD